MACESGEAARSYHAATKHSEVSLRTSGHYLDWNTRPPPFKVYRQKRSIDLPRDLPHPKRDSLETILEQPVVETGPVTIKNLAELLFFSAGLTRRVKMGSEYYYMRAASATGALYPIELYVLAARVQGLDPGVYHFNPLAFSLVVLREGDYSTELMNATSTHFQTSPLTVAFTSLAWRNAWKYEARSYRHWFWDAGVIIANLLAICSSEGLPTRLRTGFVDEDIDRLLGLRPLKEATVAIAEIGTPTEIFESSVKREVTQLEFGNGPLSQGEVDYPIIWETNKASELHNPEEVNTWRQSLKPATVKTSSSYPRFPLRPSILNSLSLSSTILRRGSTRRFAQQPISFEALSRILESSTGSIPLDFLKADQSIIEFYFIANDVKGLPSGSYHFDRETKTLEQLKEGKMRYASGYLSLEQLLFSDASVVFFLMTDLGRVLTGLGDRGYRAAQLEAGIRAGKIYLSAYALGVGASGSTFYDDAVTEFFSPRAKNLSTMIEVGIGVPAYTARPGKILPQFGNPNSQR